MSMSTELYYFPVHDKQEMQRLAHGIIIDQSNETHKRKKDHMYVETAIFLFSTLLCNSFGID